jgi:hypothetical protein
MLPIVCFCAVALFLLAALTIKSLLQNPFHTHSNIAAGVVSWNC